VVYTQLLQRTFSEPSAERTIIKAKWELRIVQTTGLTYKTVTYNTSIRNGTSSLASYFLRNSEVPDELRCHLELHFMEPSDYSNAPISKYFDSFGMC
jgi:hypothetical protein